MSDLNTLKKNEQDSDAVYREMAIKCQNSYINKILTILALEENKHYNIIKNIENNSRFQYFDSNVIQEIKKIFNSMVADKAYLNLSCSFAVKDLCKKAKDIELKSEQMFHELADATNIKPHKEIYNKIASEEKQHFKILNMLLEMVSRPDSWFDNSEWTHIDNI
ncbi:MAG: hypothetical protein ACD_79C00669G0006 [uncultured bacterium]|nr:MAG: hypothetical protein ACD_79C00669G0006 [uncultured bacterium]